MRLWAEERRTGSIELLLTMPVTMSQAVIGKYLAAWLFTGIALLLSAPIWVTVNYLGAPDNGVIVACYIASFLMAGAFMAIGSMISATTKTRSSPLSSDHCLFRADPRRQPGNIGLFRRLGAAGGDRRNRRFGFDPFPGDQRGVIDLRDLISSVHHWLSALCQRSRPSEGRLKMRARPKPVDAWRRTAPWPGDDFVPRPQPAVDQFVGRSARGFDRETLYTLLAGDGRLSPHRRAVILRFFYSRDFAAAVPAIGSYAQRVQDLLREYAELSGGRIRLQIIDPDALLGSRGPGGRLRPAKVRWTAARAACFWLVGTNNTDDVEAIAFLQADRELFLEYDISRMVHALLARKRTVVGILSTRPINGQARYNPQTGQQETIKPFAVMDQINDFLKPACWKPISRGCRKTSPS